MLPIQDEDFTSIIEHLVTEDGLKIPYMSTKSGLSCGKNGKIKSEDRDSFASLLIENKAFYENLPIKENQLTHLELQAKKLQYYKMEQRKIKKLKMARSYVNGISSFCSSFDERIRL